MPTLKTSSESYERDIDSMQFALDRHIFGSVDDVRRRVDEFIENGVQHFELKIIYPTMDSLHPADGTLGGKYSAALQLKIGVLE